MIMKSTKRNTETLLTHSRRHVKLAVVPHASNQYRPHIVRWYGLALVFLVVFIAIGPSFRVSEAGSVLGVKATVTPTSLLEATNVQRQKSNIMPLHYNEQLSAAASMKVRDMFQQQYWAHEAPNGATPWSWFSKAGYDYAYAGENLAKNFTTTSATMSAWMASKTHKDNILNPHYTDVGFAVMDGALNGKQSTLIVAMYGQPVAAVAGATLSRDTAAALQHPNLGIIAQFGVALQSMTPAALGSIVLLFVVAIIALGAHTYRRKLPLAVRRSWRYHHGLYKAVGLASGIVAIVTLYSGGQI